MDASQERVFHYHADANALGGVLTHPYKTVISTAANSSLSNAGGYNSSATVPYHLDHVLQCKAAYTHTTGGEEGEEDNGNWATLTTSVAQHINPPAVLTSPKIVPRTGPTHPQ